MPSAALDPVRTSALVQTSRILCQAEVPIFASWIHNGDAYGFVMTPIALSTIACCVVWSSRSVIVPLFARVVRAPAKPFEQR
jgi:hypothetical protein